MQGSNQPDHSIDRHLLLTVAEAAAQLRVSKWTLYQLIWSRQLNSIKIRSRRFIPSAELQAFVSRLGDEEAA
jgi:excisionase family DNA binding protein